MNDHPLLKIQRENHILKVSINHPKANAISNSLSCAMGDVFAEFRDDSDLRVAILTAEGDKFFCAGWDLKAAAEGDAVQGDYGVGGFGGIQELPNLNKPVICAVNGICCGGGLELALSCDIILSCAQASFALPEINSGTIADAASIKLPKRIPYHIAMEMLLTGRWLSSDEALRWGIVNRVLLADELQQAAWELATTLVKGPPLVFAAIKEVVRESENQRFQDSLDKIKNESYPTVQKLYNSEDHLEGPRAFAEKREPQWKGK